MAKIKLDFDSNAKETAMDMRSLSAGIKNVSIAFGVVGTAVSLVASKIASLSFGVANSQKELANFARLAGVSSSEFKKLSFATDTVGISAEKLADVSKDVKEKLGEFASVGTGAFTDFKDVMGISDAKARSLAETLSKMSSTDAILEITKMLESKGVDDSKISFVLESLGSDLTLLMPLLKNGGKEWKNLTNEFDKSTSKFAITKDMNKDLMNLSLNFSLLSETVSMASDYMGAVFAPAVNSAVESVRDAIGSGGFDEMFKQSMGALADFGILALDVLSPVAYIVEKIADGFNKIATVQTALTGGFLDFNKSLLKGSSVSSAFDIAGRSFDATMEKGARREEAISNLGYIAGTGAGSLERTLLALRDSIEKSNATQSAMNRSNNNTANALRGATQQ